MRLLKAGVEAAMVPNPFRDTVRFEAPGTYQMLFKTGGWIEGVEPFGFGPGDRYDLDGNGRKLIVTVTPRPGHPREVAFSLRPQGAPVWLEGARDGKPLSPSDVYIAQEGIHPTEVPFKLPEIETEKERAENIFAAPREGEAPRGGPSPTAASRIVTSVRRPRGSLASCGSLRRERARSRHAAVPPP